MIVQGADYSGYVVLFPNQLIDRAVIVQNVEFAVRILPEGRDTEIRSIFH